jgi:hypothetical protein
MGCTVVEGVTDCCADAIGVKEIDRMIQKP